MSIEVRISTSFSPYELVEKCYLSTFYVQSIQSVHYFVYLTSEFIEPIVYSVCIAHVFFYKP